MDELKPCPFCGTTEHLSIESVGVLAGDMPDRPYRVVCHHIDHDTVAGPIAYGRYAAIAAWNNRAPDPRTAELEELLREVRLQLEYLNGRWPTGTTPAVIARIYRALERNHDDR